MKLHKLLNLMFCTNKKSLTKGGLLALLCFLSINANAQFWDTTYLPKPINELTFDTIDNLLLIKPNGYSYNNIIGNFFSWDGVNLKKLAICSTGGIEGLIRFKAKTLVYGNQWSINNLPKTTGIVEWNMQNNTFTKVDTGGLLGEGPFVMQEFRNRLYFGTVADYHKKNLGYLDANFKQHYHPDSVPLAVEAMTVYKGKLIFAVNYRPRNYPNLTPAYDSLVAGNCVAYLDSNFVLHPFARNSTTNGGFGWFVNYHNKLYGSGAFNVLDGDSVTGFVVYNDSLDKWEPASDQRLYCDYNFNFNRIPILWSRQILNDKIVIVGEISHIDTARAYCVVEYDDQTRKFRNIGLPYFDAARWSVVYKNSLLISTSLRKPNNQIVPFIARMRWDTTSAVREVTARNQYSISPNPAKGYCILKCNNSSQNYINVTDVSGNLILTDTYFKEYRINTLKLKPGIYQIITNEKNSNKPSTTLKMAVE